MKYTGTKCLAELFNAYRYYLIACDSTHGASASNTYAPASITYAPAISTYALASNTYAPAINTYAPASITYAPAILEKWTQETRQ